MVNSISQYGVTFTFDQAYQSGQYANGDYWVLGPVTITSISPAFASGRNGWEVNPSSTVNQGFDDRLPDYTPSLVPSLPYTSSGPIESIVKTISLTVAPTWPKLQTAVVLTVVTTVPPNNGATTFRPAYFGTTWKPTLSTQSLNTQLLPTYAPVANMPSLSDIENDFQRLQLDHRTDWQGRGFHPVDNMPDYGASISLLTGSAALRLMINDPVTAKMQALINYVQAGIDLYAIAFNGGQWLPMGGHGCARKLPITFAAVLLQDQNMQMNIANWAAIGTTFQEDNDFYFSQQANNGNGMILFGQDFWSEYHYWRSIIQLVGSKSHVDPYGYIDGGRTPGGEYQFCCVSMPNKGIATALLLMPELQCVWNNDLFIQYIDRWVTFGTWTQNDPCAPADLSDTDMSDYGITYGPDGNGGCILDTDPSDGIGRFPNQHGTNANAGYYQNTFGNALWNAYRSTLSINQCLDCLDEEIDLSNSSITTDLMANIRIVSNGTVITGSNVEYTAGDIIELENDFEVDQNANFHAYIEACQ